LYVNLGVESPGNRNYWRFVVFSIRGAHRIKEGPWRADMMALRLER
jgi:hypothetical protein